MKKGKKLNLKEYYNFVEKRSQERLRYLSIEINVQEENNDPVSSTKSVEKLYEKFGRGEPARLVIKYKGGSRQTIFADKLGFDMKSNNPTILGEIKLSFATVGDMDIFESKNKTEDFDVSIEDSIMSNKDKISRILEVEQYLTRKVIEGRTSGYKPCFGDEDQPLRDEVDRLRKEIGIG